MVGNEVVLQLPADVSSPTTVRYGWSDYVDCTLRNNVKTFSLYTAFQTRSKFMSDLFLFGQDSLPAGPFLLDIGGVVPQQATTAPAESEKERAGAGAIAAVPPSKMQGSSFPIKIV